ncbi:universal stress protein [Spirosoma migulaei]
MKTILVPVDFSKTAENALIFAINLSQKLQAHIILFHSFHTYHTNAYVSAKALEQESLTAKLHADQKLKELYDNISVSAFSPPEYISSKNELREELLQLLAERSVELIVMGTQGLGNKLEGRLFGTNTSWVVEKATCPVIVIPENLQLETLEEIVYASDYMPDDIVNLENLSKIAQSFQANITVIHVIKEESTAAVNALKSFEQQVKVRTQLSGINFRLLTGNNVENRLEQYLEENKVNLLVMSAHYRSLPDKLFGKSLTKSMTLYAGVPLMIFHHKLH